MDSSAKQRHDALREQRLEKMAQQIADGTLVVRQMTAAERKRYAPRKRTPDEIAEARRRRY